MAENVVPRRQYTKEFKVEAVRLAESVGQHEAACRLGVPVAYADGKSVHCARRNTQYHRVALCRCRLCYEQRLNGEPDALRGASPVRGGETGR